MVKVIVAESKLDCQHLLGQFVDDSHYDYLIEEDCDVYMPPDCDLSTKVACGSDRDCSSCPSGSDEKRIVLKFRKNFFTKEEQDNAYEGLRGAAKISHNRGIAAGPKMLNTSYLRWVSEYQQQIIDYFSELGTSLDDSDRLDEVIEKYKDMKDVAGYRSNIWAENTIRSLEYKWDFDEWVEKTRNLPIEEARKEAEWVQENLCSTTSYANPVHSGIAGWFDRYPRYPFGRATAYTNQNFETFKKSWSFLQHLAKGFKDLLPWRYENQMKCARMIDSNFLVPGTPFTTITVNKTFRTACHYDAGDLSEGLSNLLVLSNNGNYSGGYLVAPEYRVAVNVRPGDLLLINNHEVMHGNTEITLHDEEAERISLVCYFRENMLQLGSKEYEDCRFNYVESRRLNKDHKHWRKGWNGISPNMWDEQEWFDYLESNLGESVLLKYHPDSKKNTLDDFFS